MKFRDGDREKVVNKGFFQCIPRASGGDPIGGRSVEGYAEYSPRKRG